MPTASRQTHCGTVRTVRNICDNIAARNARADCSAAKNGSAVHLFLGLIKLQFQWVCDIIVKVFWRARVLRRRVALCEV